VLSGIAYLNHVYQYRANTCTIGQNIAQTKQYVYYRTDYYKIGNITPV